MWEKSQIHKKHIYIYIFNLKCNWCIYKHKTTTTKLRLLKAMKKRAKIYCNLFWQQTFHLLPQRKTFWRFRLGADIEETSRAELSWNYCHCYQQRENQRKIWESCWIGKGKASWGDRFSSGLGPRHSGGLTPRPHHVEAPLHFSLGSARRRCDACSSPVLCSGYRSAAPTIFLGSTSRIQPPHEILQNCSK